MALPAIAALIARMVGQRAGVAALTETLAARGGISSLIGRAGAGAAAEAEGGGVARLQAAAQGAQPAVGQRFQFKTAEEMLKRPRPQAPRGGVDVGGIFYKAGRFIPRAAVESALGQSSGGIPARPIDSLWSRPGPPPIQAPPVQNGGVPGASPGESGADASRPLDQLTSGVQKLMLVLGPTAAVGVVLGKLPNQVDRFGRSLLDAQLPLRRFSGSINEAFAKLERNDLRRMRDRAEATAGSTSTLAKAIDQLGDDTKELRQGAITFLNLIGLIATFIGRIVAILIKFDPVMAFLMKVLRLIEGFLKTLDPRSGSWHTHVKDLANQKFTGKHNDPKGKP